MAVNIPHEPADTMAPRVLTPHQFIIFSELEKTSSKQSQAMSVSELRNMAAYIRNGKKYLIKLKNDIYIENVQLHLKLKKTKQLIVDIKKHQTESSSVYVKKYLKEMLKTEGKIQILKNRLNKIDNHEILYKDFVRRVENAGSPQQLDIYVASIEEEQNKLMGNPPRNENPVALKKLIRFLQKKEKEAQAKEQLARSKGGAVLGAITSPKAALPLKILATYIPNDLESWAHEGVDSKQLQEAIICAQQKHDEAFQRMIESLDKTERLAFLTKIKVLDEMINYTETAKHNFDRRLNFSSAMHTAASIFSLLSTTVAGALAFVPGANLIAEGFKKTFEFLGYSSLVAAQAADPNVSPEDDLAAKRHYQAMKDYNFAETIFAGFGTLALASAAILPVVATVALPIAPVLLFVGAANMMVSNVISAYSSYQDYHRTQEVLKKNVLHPKLKDLEARAQRGDNTLSKAEKSLLRDNLHSNEVLARFKSRVSTSLGAGMFAFLAGAFVAAAIGFPPFGALVATVLTVATAATAVYSVYQRHQEKKLAKAAYKMNEEIQSLEIRSALDTIKPDLDPTLKSGVKLDVKAKLGSKPDPKLQQAPNSSDLREAVETPSKATILHAAKLTAGGKLAAGHSTPSLREDVEAVRSAAQTAHSETHHHSVPDDSARRGTPSTQHLAESPVGKDIDAGGKEPSGDIPLQAVASAPIVGTKGAAVEALPQSDKAPPVPERPQNKHTLLERHKMMLKSKDKGIEQPTEGPIKPSRDGSKHHK